MVVSYIHTYTTTHPLYHPNLTPIRPFIQTDDANVVTQVPSIDLFRPPPWCTLFLLSIIPPAAGNLGGTRHPLLCYNRRVREEFRLMTLERGLDHVGTYERRWWCPGFMKRTDVCARSVGATLVITPNVSLPPHPGHDALLIPILSLYTQPTLNAHARFPTPTLKYSVIFFSLLF